MLFLKIIQLQSLYPEIISPDTKQIFRLPSSDRCSARITRSSVIECDAVVWILHGERCHVVCGSVLLNAQLIDLYAVDR
jgi:hypothetical protein